MKIREILEQTDLTELNIDNRDGWGQTPNNANVDYKGLKVMMMPSTFLSLAANLPVGPAEKKSINKMIAHHKSGGTFGAPTLYVKIPREWEDGDMINAVAEVTGHEGRHRMNAQMETEGDAPVETHIFINGFRTRNWAKNNQSDYTPEIIQQLNKRLKSEDGHIESGPFFEGQK